MPASKPATQRERNGRAKRIAQQTVGAAEVQRLRNAALAGMRDAVWGTTLGWLYLNGKLTAAQFAAGRRWSGLVAEYASATAAPSQPRSASLERSARASLDPDSDAGRKQVRIHQQVVSEFTSASAMLAYAGTLRARVVGRVCEDNLMPVGVEELEHLTIGLQTLVTFWSGGRRK